MDATDEALRTMAKTLPKEGTTSFLATTMTAPVKQIERALQNAAQYIYGSNPPGEAEILGIHLEGPFISPKRAGAQHPENIIEPNYFKNGRTSRMDIFVLLRWRRKKRMAWRSRHT